MKKLMALLTAVITFFVLFGCSGGGGGGGGGSSSGATLLSIAVTPASPTVVPAETKQFAATGTYSDGTSHDITSSVTWVSVPTTVATVNSSGLATGVASGTTTITASSGAISGNTTLTVSSILSSIAVTPANPSVAIAATIQFTATGTYSDGTSHDITTSVTWSVPNTGVATIDAGGLATGVAAGLATITATSGAISGNTTLTVSAWTSHSFGTTSWFDGIVWSGTQFVAVGDTIVTSPDGITWTLRKTGVSLAAVTWSGTKFVAVGTNGTILTSLDGITWTSQTSGTTRDLVSVTWSGTKFVAVGNDPPTPSVSNYLPFSITSSDGITWSSESEFVLGHISAETIVLGDMIFNIAWLGTEFVAVGYSDVIVTSPDLVLWTEPASGSNRNLHSATWSGTKFVVVGDVGTILTSPDSITWSFQPPHTQSSDPTFTQNNLYGVTWAGTEFVAVGDKGTILTSPDGITWTSQAPGTSSALYGIAWSGTKFVVVGANGTILTSQ